MKSYFGQDSGFVSYKSDKLSVAINLFGNQSKDKDFDPRLIGGVPFWASWRNAEILPSIPYNTGSITSKSTWFPFGTSINYIYNTIKHRKSNSPINAGFLPYILNRSSIICFTGANKINSVSEEGTTFQIEIQGKLHQFKQGYLTVLYYATKRILREWVTINTKLMYHDLIEETGITCKRIVFIQNDALYIKDKYYNNNSDISLKNLVPFTFRTFKDSQFLDEDDYITLSSQPNGPTMYINMFHGEKIVYKRTLFSSTGMVKLWEIRNNNNNKQYQTERLILFGEYPIKQEIKAEIKKRLFAFKEMLGSK